MCYNLNTKLEDRGKVMDNKIEKIMEHEEKTVDLEKKLKHMIWCLMVEL